MSVYFARVFEFVIAPANRIGIMSTLHATYQFYLVLVLTSELRSVVLNGNM